MKMKIGVFDSGKGGTTVLKAIQKRLPDLEYKYIADSKNCPYGEKSDGELKNIVEKNVDALKKWGAQIIVVACNTATTKCIDNLRKKYPQLVFVGTEPAIKLAVKSKARRILIMATPGTIQSERIATLVKENQKIGQEIVLLGCPGLADAIEKGERVEDKLDELRAKLEGEFDVLVLGCTHYSLIKTKIQKYFPKTRLVDGNEGIAKQVEKVVENLCKNE